MELNRKIVELSKEVSLPLVATNDVYYLNAKTPVPARL